MDSQLGIKRITVFAGRGRNCSGAGGGGGERAVLAGKGREYSDVGGGRREQGSRRGEKARADAGELVHRRMTGVSWAALRSRAHPPPTAAAPNVRVRPRGWAKPLAQGAQYPQNTAKSKERSACKQSRRQSTKSATVAPTKAVRSVGESLSCRPRTPALM